MEVNLADALRDLETIRKHWIVVQPMHSDEESELGYFGEQDCYLVREAQDPLPKFRLFELELITPLSL